MKFRYDKENEKLILTDSTRLEYNQLKIWLKREPKENKYNPKVKLGLVPRERDYFFSGYVAPGLWKECAKCAQMVGTNFEIENKDEFPINRNITAQDVKDFCQEFFKDHLIYSKEHGKNMPFMPRDYQIETAYKILRNRYCIGEVATSGGKSLILSIVFFYILSRMKKNARFLLIVPSITLVTQFYNDIRTYNFGDDKSNKNPLDLRIEEIMSDAPRKYFGDDIPNIYIGCFQSLEKYPEQWFKQFFCVSVDEAHQAKCYTIESVLKRTFKRAYYRFGVSGTFPNEMSCEILSIQSVLGPKVASVSADFLIKEGNISPVTIKAMILDHDDKQFDEQLKTIRKNVSKAKDAYVLEKKYVLSSEKRMLFLSKLVSSRKQNTLILFNSIEYGEKLLEYLQKNNPDKEYYYIDGAIRNKKRNEIKAIMERTDGPPKILLATYGTLSTGVSINAIFNVVLAEGFRSEQRIIQSIGRALRLHEQKIIATIFDIVDVFVEKEYKNSFYKQFVERVEHYTKHKYPYSIKKVYLGFS